MTTELTPEEKVAQRLIDVVLPVEEAERLAKTLPTHDLIHQLANADTLFPQLSQARRRAFMREAARRIQLAEQFTGGDDGNY